jgi:L-alanine-DL-glutamate epimerase-like enolase superfamily enzyme
MSRVAANVSTRPSITAVRTHGLRFPREDAIADARFKFDARQAVIVEVETNEGLRGIGEAAAFGGSLESLRAVVEHDLAPLLAGADPRAIVRLHDRLVSRTYQRSRRGLVLAAISGLDMALWDLAGQRAGLPLHELLGAAGLPLPAYASGGFYPAAGQPDPVYDETAAAIERGFRAVKIKVGGLGLSADAERVRRVREQVGPSIRLMIDANGAYRPKEALALWRAVADLDISWFEEPVACDHLDAAAAIAASLGCPVAGYETEGTAAGFRQLIERSAVDVVQPDVTWCGGITEARRIVALAEASGRSVALHAYGSAIGFFGNLQLLAASRDPEPMELDITANALRDELTDPAPDDLFADGLIALPDGPGLGIRLEPAALARWAA